MPLSSPARLPIKAMKDLGLPLVIAQKNPRKRSGVMWDRTNWIPILVPLSELSAAPSNGIRGK